MSGYLSIKKNNQIKNVPFLLVNVIGSKRKTELMLYVKLLSMCFIIAYPIRTLKRFS
jgi:hypothetical protein